MERLKWKGRRENISSKRLKAEAEKWRRKDCVLKGGQKMGSKVEVRRLHGEEGVEGGLRSCIWIVATHKSSILFRQTIQKITPVLS